MKTKKFWIWRDNIGDCWYRIYKKKPVTREQVLHNWETSFCPKGFKRITGLSLNKGEIAQFSLVREKT